eukprot:1025052-Pelagomonas_calceolata.AAC.7
MHMTECAGEHIGAAATTPGPHSNLVLGPDGEGWVMSVSREPICRVHWHACRCVCFRIGHGQKEGGKQGCAPGRL